MNLDVYKERLKKYNETKTPEELLEFMDKYITYGIYGTDGKSYTNWENDINSEFQVACQTKYALCDKERMLKYGLGTCWDQVELERFWFKEHNYNFKTFFIWFYFEERNDYGTHTYLVYERNNKYYYFEHSDSNNRGIHEFDSYEEAIEYQMSKHIDFMKQIGLPINKEILKHIQVIEFNINKYEIDMNDYFENLFNSNIIYENNRFVSDLITKNKLI